MRGPGREEALVSRLSWMLVAAWLGCAVSAPAAASVPPPRPGTSAIQDARALHDSALRHLAQGTFDSRRLAIGELEQATLEEPGNFDYELTLARAYFQAGYLKSARQRYQRVMGLVPDDASAHFGLGQVWRRDWLKFLDRASLANAIAQFSAAARLAPERSDAWVMLASLQMERGERVASRAAAAHALEDAPASPDAQLASAMTEFRNGEVARAESLFRVALSRMSREVRERFDDISPVASEQDTAVFNHLGPVQKQEFLRRFWKEIDPDPASPENEAQLEYWARIAQAYFLYYNARLRQWDERGEVYVRFGPPESAEYNPLGFVDGAIYDGTVTYQSGFPSNTLMWHYPSLGMDVMLQDRLLTESYLLPIQLWGDPDPRPSDAALEARGDIEATHDRRGVFPVLPPLAERLPLAGTVARFGGGEGGRVLAAVVAPGSARDSLWATWVVLDSAEVEVARVAETLSPSACDPAGSRATELLQQLPAGRYHVSVSVRNERGARGTWIAPVALRTDDGQLAISDVVITCAAPEPNVLPVRPAADPEAAIEPGQPVSAYFEIYHLKTGDDARSRFEYVYTVRSADRDPRIWIQRLVSPRPRIPSVSASREDENLGELRRQFLKVPLETLPPGHYWLEIHVRDVLSGAETDARQEFRVLGEPPPGPGPTTLTPPGH
jgi:GWxTD domain-containing protein